MKLGIITQPLACNYGGILQNYALQQVLRRMGHEVWTLDYQKFTWLDYADTIWRVLGHKLLGHKASFWQTPPQRRKTEHPLRRFAEENISLTKRTRHFERRLLTKYAFDAVVVGSDQVWRPQYNYRVEDCFLEFAKGLPIKRIAYAASFGTDKWEFSPAQTKRCAALAKRFDALSVREVSGVALCKDYLGVKATHVLDPTLLLSAEDYTVLCHDIPHRKPFVFAYILDLDEHKKQEIESFAAAKGLPYVVKSADSRVSQDDSIEKWLSCFRDAAYVITDSFHGTVFSIIFNKDFYVYGNPQRGNARFDSLLSTFGLQSRMTGSVAPNTSVPIDWNNVDKKRLSKINHSQTWLKQQLQTNPM